MRYKFRAWYKVEKVMEHPMTVKDMIAMVPGPDLNLDDYEIMQFTGLHDKNGIPIYEGDIIEFTDKWEWYRGEYWAKIQFAKDEEERKAVMDRYENEPMERRAVEIDISEGVNFSTYDLEQGRWEVIGNIYQHPELINRR